MPSACKTIKLTARGDDRNTKRLNRVPAAMARLDCAKLIVARCRGLRWVVSEKMGRAGNAGIDFRTGSLVVFQRQSPALRGHQETARFPGGPPSAPAAAPRSLSRAFCVGTIGLASVSPIVRSVSSSVRRRHPIVSANLRRKVPLIARRAGYDCAPLHLITR